MESEQTGLSIEQFLGVLRRRAPWVVACLVLVPGAVYGYSRHETKEYSAIASLAFNSDQIDQQIAGLSSSASGLTPLAQQASDLELVKGGVIAAETAALLGHGLTGDKVSESVHVAAQGESTVVDVEAISTSPPLAAAIANTYADQFVKRRHATTHRFFKAALAFVHKQLAAMSLAQRVGSDGLDLQDRAHTLALLGELGYNEVEVASEALTPTSPSSPRTKRNTILGAVVGLLLGLGVAFLIERRDRRIREPEELEALYHLPLLGLVPKSVALARFARNGEGDEGPALVAADAEAFSLIRAHLRFFNVDRDMRTIVVVSPAPGDGKSTIARHLAEAAARLGERVLLMELDLRHPTLARQLGIGSGPGLAGALIGTTSIEEATQSVALQASPGEGTSGRRLDVILAGSVLPPNPAELLDSRAMDVVLERAKTSYDLVVMDTPPLVAVSDAFPLLTKVDGVVIVGWVGRSRRDAAEQLRQVLSSSDVPLLGVIANGAKSNGLGSYAESGKGNSSNMLASANSASSAEELAPTASS